MYARSYDARFPVVCMDEQPFQLLSEARSPVPLGAGRGRAVDYEYVREGTCTVWMFVEPLGCWRDVRVTSRRTALAWAQRIRALVDAPRYAGAERITLVCDNLNTHDFGSLYTAFAPVEAKRIMDRLEMVFTPKHGSWLNIAESELSVLTRQSLADRLGSESAVEDRVMPWTQERNRKQIVSGVKSASTGNSPRRTLARSLNVFTRKSRRDRPLDEQEFVHLVPDQRREIKILDIPVCPYLAGPFQTCDCGPARR